MDTNTLVLFGPARGAVLSLLLSNPDESLHLREIVRRTGLGHGAIQRELGLLVAAGILERRPSGRQVYFQANRGCPIFPELQGLVIKTTGVAGVLRDALRDVRGIRLAFIYGSFARGQQRHQSDVDVMVIGNVGLSRIVAALRPARQRLAREINPSVYPAAEFSRKLRAGHHFVSTVMRERKVMLIGNEHELEAMGAKRLAHAAPDESAGNLRPVRAGRSRSFRLSGESHQR
jgi:predicted nucleotidyltransferase